MERQPFERCEEYIYIIRQNLFATLNAPATIVALFRGWRQRVAWIFWLPLPPVFVTGGPSSGMSIFKVALLIASTSSANVRDASGT